MALLSRIKSAFRFGYDAVDNRNRRKAPSVSLLSEDRALGITGRRQVATGARDLQRNFAIAAWAIRKHLDYVSTFSFQARTGDAGLDDELEGLMDWWQRPVNCDAMGRFSLSRMVRALEQARTVDGDVLVNLLADGRLQGVEGDRVCDSWAAPLPDGATPEQIVHGVWINTNGRPNAYAVHKRTASGMEFEKWLPAQFAYLHGYFHRFDQLRGVSPLVAAMNTFRDVYEGFDYALAKAKVSQLFALAFFRDGADPVGESEDTGEGGDGQPRYKVNLSGGPQMIDLDPGDRAEFLESKNPSTEFQAFSQLMIGVALKALDIPYSFYDEAHTNYSGARQAMLQYEQSADAKRADVRQMLDRLTAWRMQMFIRGGDLPGVSMSDLRWEWIPRGLPWIDPVKEAAGDTMRIGAGLASPQQIAKERGFDAFEVLDQIAEWRNYAASVGVPITTGNTGVSNNGNTQDTQSSTDAANG